MLSLAWTRTDTDARGIARMASTDLAELGLTVGATVRLAGGRPAFARAIPGRVPAGTVEIDGLTAANCAAAPDEPLTVTPEPLGPLDHALIRVDQAVGDGPDDFHDALFDMALAEGDALSVALRNGRRVAATVVRALPGGAGLVGDGTRIAIETPPGANGDFDAIGGLKQQIAAVQEIISAPLLRPELFQRLGIPAPRGILFSGPPGSGKTLLARTVARQTRAAFFQINGPEIQSKYHGESEAALREVFEAAGRAQPAIIFIDEIDSLAPRRDGLSSERQVERRVVAQLLTLMDGMTDRGRVVVMAATNIPDSLDPALRRPGRFDREIRFLPPTEAERRQILAVHLAQAPLGPDVDLDRIADAAHGYVGADLAAVAREAAVAALSRSIRAAGTEAAVRLEDLHVTQADLQQGLARTGPSLLRGATDTATPVRWDDIGGLDAAKLALRQAVEWPVRHAAAMRELGLAPPRGILLTGAPGGGKTMLARALATEASLNFIPVRPPDLASQFPGEAEKAVRSLFERARLAAPSLLFFDEFDAVAPRRGTAGAVFDRIVAQLLVEIDGLVRTEGLAILAATNRPGAIDPAILRPGRIDRVIDLPAPDEATRRAILAIHFGRRHCADDLDTDALARLTDGASGADLAALAETAGWTALTRRVTTGGAGAITQADALAAHATIARRKSLLAADHLQPDARIP